MTRRYGGAGLGLAISRRIVEIIGGTIRFTSEPGKGSTFWFSIPLRRGGAAAPHRPTLDGLRVLAVDDNPASLDIIRRQIEGDGGQVETAGDVAGGLAMAREAAAGGKPFDVAVLDHQMPGDTGLEMAAWINSDPRLGEMKVILATSRPSASLRAEVANAGVGHVLAKPIRQRMLIARILELVRGAEPFDPMPALVAPDPGTCHGAFRILVVDDVAINRQLAAAMLNRAGYNVDVAAGGQEAIEKISKSGYDLILMDVQMPSMNGVAATGLIRALPGRGAGVPVIAMTANAMDGDRDTLMAAGMSDYIAKPFTLNDLIALIDRWHRHIKVSAAQGHDRHNDRDPDPKAHVHIAK